MSAPNPSLAGLLDGPSRWHSLTELEETTSTNDVVAERAAAGEAPGLVVVAERQTEGRGRLGRRWEDPGSPGLGGTSLLVSVLVEVPPRNDTLVPLAAGVAAVDALRRNGARAELKWPNDLLLEVDGADRKCGGLLVERHDDRVVVGCGINLDWRGVQREGEAAAWTSVAEVTGADVDRYEVLADYLRALEAWLRDVPEDPARLLASYRVRCRTLGRQVRVTVPSGDAIVGRAIDLAEDGGLVIEDVEHAVVVTAGDVEHVRDA